MRWGGERAFQVLLEAAGAAEVGGAAQDPAVVGADALAWRRRARGPALGAAPASESGTAARAAPVADGGAGGAGGTGGEPTSGGGCAERSRVWRRERLEMFAGRPSPGWWTGSRRAKFLVLEAEGVEVPLLLG